MAAAAGGAAAMAERGGRPRVTFFPPPCSRPRAGPSSFVDPEMSKGRQLPESRLPKSVLRASQHAQQLLDVKIKRLEDTKKKTELYHKRLRQQFLKEQERKMARWKKASERFEKSLEVFSRKAGTWSVPPAGGVSTGKCQESNSKAMPPKHAATDGKATKGDVERAPPAGWSCQAT